MTRAGVASVSSDVDPRGGRAHVRALTGLRFFAALAVYVSHLRPPAWAPSWLRTLQQSGYAGVTFFFVLSGFVLTLNYADSLRTPSQLRSYAVARFARIYPLYLVVLAWPAVHLWAAGTLPRKALLLHVLALQSWSPDLAVAFGFVGPAWSISVELFLYAALPLLLPLVRPAARRVRGLAIAVLVVLALLFAVALLFQVAGRGALPWSDPGSAHRWLYRTPVLRLGDFTLGILAAGLYGRLRGTPPGVWLGRWLLVAGIVLAICAGASSDLLFTAWSWDALYAGPAVAIVLGFALAPRHPLSRVLARPSVVLLGEASFAFYLCHKTVIQVTGAGAWPSGFTVQSLAVELGNLAAALALGVGLHVGIEKPARAAVRRLLDRPRVGRGDADDDTRRLVLSAPDRDVPTSWLRPPARTGGGGRVPDGARQPVPPRQAAVPSRP